MKGMGKMDRIQSSQSFLLNSTMATIETLSSRVSNMESEMAELRKGLRASLSQPPRHRSPLATSQYGGLGHLPGLRGPPTLGSDEEVILSDPT